MHSNDESSFLLEGMRNGHIAWKTILQTARSSGVAGMVVEEALRILSKMPERSSGRHETMSKSTSINLVPY